MEVKSMFSEKGIKLLVLNKYKFSKAHVAKSGKIRWRCAHTKSRCSAKFYTASDETTVLDTELQHNHAPDDTIARQIISNGVKRKVRDDATEKPSKLIQKELVINGQWTAELGSDDLGRVRQNIYAARRTVLPTLPKSRNEVFDAVVNLSPKNRMRNEDFLCVADKNNDDMQPYNLSMKPNENASPPHTSNGKPDAIVKTSAAPPLSPENERNRAELARLSVELGLNRPEMFLAKSKSPNSLAEITTSMGLLAQWNNIILQHQKNQGAKVTAPADTSTSVGSYPTTTTPPSEKKTKAPKVEKEQPFDEAVWYWLKSQQNSAAGVPVVESNKQHKSPATSVSSSTNSVTSTSQSDANGSSWFWKWYKQFAGSYPLPQHNPDKPILYQQLTRDRDSNSENINTNEEEEKAKLVPQAKNKARAVLDNLLFNNNNNLSDVTSNKRESSPDVDLSQLEAIEHGEKFLNWLERCSEPSVTAMQIMQFRYLLNNIKSGVDRKKPDSQNRCKVRRK